MKNKPAHRLAPSGPAQAPRERLAGLDLARWLALAGMVCVNFRLAMAPAGEGDGWLRGLFHLLEGKASSTFVVLAGIGYVLATRSLPPAIVPGWTVRRALFLLVVGTLNLLVFPADIIHYYAVYFLCALPWRRASALWLAAGVGAVAGISAWALMHFDYSQGWDWTALHYTDLWTPPGFVRNLVFNGFHPLLPWLAFFLFGMLLARLDLTARATQSRLALGGIGAVIAAALLARASAGTPVGELLGTGPLPPGPAYLLMGMGTAALVVGTCLLAAARWPDGPWQRVLPAGRMTLTLYLAHIFLGMGVLEAFGALHGSDADVALAAGVFLVVGTCAAWAWSRRVAQGPVEALMRRLTAPRR
ncbi:putative membrane protein YeiB [Pseudoduganella flava]|uniref:DUF1624 domain-containing protein n=1 Tax=Pseudoduganella flava TaxID=871742 RepID=A0A562PKI3_9BURK|nr:acyltransferase family protein [Pseudoduganella flava]QGZ42377.1 DUF1624 domain-containing protein [Pseudoduganella flava]TWI44939.1 putative membrane protein YeiB [Pseudoduganella flava]